VSGEVDGASRDGDGTPSVRDTKVACRSDDVTANRLNVGREIEVVTVTAEKVFGASGGVRVVIAVSGGTGGEVESLLEGLIALTEGLFRHLREFAYLPETTRDMGLTTGNEDASGDNSFRWLPPKEFLLVGTLVYLLRYVADRLRERKLLAHGRDVSEGCEYVSFRTGAVGSRGCSLEFARETRTSITEADHSVELLNTLHQGVRSGSNTGRVVAFVVREGLHVADPKDSRGIKHC